MCLYVGNNSRKAIRLIKEALAKNPKPLPYVYIVDGKLRVATKGCMASKLAILRLMHHKDFRLKLAMVAGKCRKSMKIFLDCLAAIVATL